MEQLGQKPPNSSRISSNLWQHPGESTLPATNRRSRLKFRRKLAPRVRAISRKPVLCVSRASPELPASLSSADIAQVWRQHSTKSEPCAILGLGFPGATPAIRRMFARSWARLSDSLPLPPHRERERESRGVGGPLQKPHIGDLRALSARLRPLSSLEFGLPNEPQVLRKRWPRPDPPPGSSHVMPADDDDTLAGRGFRKAKAEGEVAR